MVAPPYNSILFLSTLSLRRATRRFRAIQNTQINISIHALLAESDSNIVITSQYSMYFYPRSPCGERHISGATDLIFLAFLSTLSLRRATRSHRRNDRSPIHFYPRSPCGERPAERSDTKHYDPFLSTLSLRRATRETTSIKPIFRDFYPRSPCGERPR